MFSNSSNPTQKPRVSWQRKALMALSLTLWVLASFALAQLILVALVYALDWVGVPFAAVNSAVINTAVAACAYMLSLVITIGIPWIAKKRRTSAAEVGLKGLPTWTDIGLAPAGFVVYFIASASLIYMLTQLIPAFNVDEVQDVGFDKLSQQYEYLLAFITLVVIAPFAEEALFRGYLYGKLRKHVSFVAAMLLVSVLFGAVHGQWNVAIDTFVLSLVMCGLREMTGSIWAGVLLHMSKNGLAFYLLFINPTLLNTIGG